ncbi:hypothetical protein [Pseudoduganella namucuonensis]|uniref:hypothetical protein n=1 Tax=Pseudoduganella namucuonensis TaxID=1035707 RepID=UPI001160BBFA|nr:hypothetical protein [Pseudoduganella namucuonensis]
MKAPATLSNLADAEDACRFDNTTALNEEWITSYIYQIIFNHERRNMKFVKKLLEKFTAKDISTINNDFSLAAKPLSDFEIIAVAGGPDLDNDPPPT